MRKTNRGAFSLFQSECKNIFAWRMIVNMATSLATIAFGGQLIDRPIVERARRALDLATMLGVDKK
jgi:citrate lyase beta subunit